MDSWAKLRIAGHNRTVGKSGSVWCKGRPGSSGPVWNWAFSLLPSRTCLCIAD